MSDCADYEYSVIDFSDLNFKKAKYDTANVTRLKDCDAEYMISADQNGNLVLTPELIKILGVNAGSEFKAVVKRDRVEFYPNIHSLSRVYIEATSCCNLACKTCIRNTWEEPMGHMDIRVFDRLAEQLKDFDHLQSVMFGGFGEPTFHRDILYMIGKIKSLGLKAEMVTNGTMLDETMLKGLIENGLDMLWVSFDGANREMFENIREGADYNVVIQSLMKLKELNRSSSHKIVVGIAFVAMKSNINDLPNLPMLAEAIGASSILVSNVLPYDKDMTDQMLYHTAVCKDDLPSLCDWVSISLPMIDFTEITKESLYKLYRSIRDKSILTNRMEPGIGCRFIKERCTFIRWDGMVCPCMGLLHSYTTYLSNGSLERKITGHSFGNVGSGRLKDIWDSQEYHDFRDKVDQFMFSPCNTCGGCEFAEKNEQDCYGNTFPTCGGCLWAQGVIQCP